MRAKVSMVVVAALVCSAANASPVFVRGVMTDCPSSTTGNARPLPGSDAQTAGLKYDMLSPQTEKFAAALVSGILAGDASAVPIVQVDQFSPPDAEGDQLRQHFHGPTSELPRSWGVCNAGQPQSLGTHDKTSFVLVEVTCPSKSQPWDKIAVGLQVESGKTPSICFNVGAPANIALPPKGRR